MSFFESLNSQLVRGDAPPHEVWNVKARTDLHLSRKAYHLLGVLVVLGLYLTLTREQGLITLGVVLAFLIPLDVMRLKSPSLNRLTYKWFKRLLRKEELNRISGMSHLLAGAFILIALFPKEIVVLSFLFLAFGDPIASIIGVLYGKDKLVGHKSLQGSAAAFVVCAITSAAYFAQMRIMTDRLVLVSLIGGLIGAVSELVPSRKMDDNFTIPVLSAVMLWITFWFFGGFH